jgi:hypothetical protein
MRRSMPVFLVLCVLLAAPGCGKKSPPATSGDVTGVEAHKPPVVPTGLAQADADFDRRHEQEATEAAIAQYEEALAAEALPEGVDRWAILVRLSVLYYGKAIFFEQDLPKKERMAMYWRGRECGWDALMVRNAAWREAIEGGTRIPDAVHLLTADDAPAAFWTATNWSRWGELKGILRVALDIPKVKAANQRILEVAEDYYAAGVHRFFGAYWVAIPSFAGKDSEKGKLHFERGISMFPDHLETAVMYADYYARDTQDKELFVRLLQGVIDATPDPAGTYYFEDMAAQADAARLLAEADAIFD